MVSVSLLEYIDKVATREINSLTFWIISRVIDHVSTRKAGNYGARIRIQNDQPFGIVGGNKQAMSSFVKCHGDIVPRLLPNRPGRNHRTFSPVYDPNCVFAGNVDEYPT
jgi:hypothetical protein